MKKGKAEGAGREGGEWKPSLKGDSLKEYKRVVEALRAGQNGDKEVEALNAQLKGKRPQEIEGVFQAALDSLQARRPEIFKPKAETEAKAEGAPDAKERVTEALAVVQKTGDRGVHRVIEAGGDDNTDIREAIYDREELVRGAGKAAERVLLPDVGGTTEGASAEGSEPAEAEKAEAADPKAEAYKKARTLYRKLYARVHPDRNGNEKEDPRLKDLRSKFQEIWGKEGKTRGVKELIWVDGEDRFGRPMRVQKSEFVPKPIDPESLLADLENFEREFEAAMSAPEASAAPETEADPEKARREAVGKIFDDLLKEEADAVATAAAGGSGFGRRFGQYAEALEGNGYTRERVVDLLDRLMNEKAKLAAQRRKYYESQGGLSADQIAYRADAEATRVILENLDNYEPGLGKLFKLAQEQEKIRQQGTDGRPRLLMLLSPEKTLNDLFEKWLLKQQAEPGATGPEAADDAGEGNSAGETNYAEGFDEDLLSRLGIDANMRERTRKILEDPTKRMGLLESFRKRYQGTYEALKDRLEGEAKDRLEQINERYAGIYEQAKKVLEGIKGRDPAAIEEALQLITMLHDGERSFREELEKLNKPAGESGEPEAPEESETETKTKTELVPGGEAPTVEEIKENPLQIGMELVKFYDEKYAPLRDELLRGPNRLKDDAEKTQFGKDTQALDRAYEAARMELVNVQEPGLDDAEKTKRAETARRRIKDFLDRVGKVADKVTEQRNAPPTPEVKTPDRTPEQQDANIKALLERPDFVLSTVRGWMRELTGLEDKGQRSNPALFEEYKNGLKKEIEGLSPEVIRELEKLVATPPGDRKREDAIPLEAKLALLEAQLVAAKKFFEDESKFPIPEVPEGEISPEEMNVNQARDNYINKANALRIHSKGLRRLLPKRWERIKARFGGEVSTQAVVQEVLNEHPLLQKGERLKDVPPDELKKRKAAFVKAMGEKGLMGYEAEAVYDAALAKMEYNAALGELGTSMIARERIRLIKAQEAALGKRFDEWTPEERRQLDQKLAEYRAGEVMNKVVINERMILQDKQVEQMPPREKGWLKKSLDWYIHLKPWQKFAVSTLFFAPFAAAGAGFSVGGYVGAKAIRFLIGLGTSKVAGGAYELATRGWVNRANRERDARIAALRTTFSGENIAALQDAYGDILEAKQQSERRRMLLKIAVVGGASFWAAYEGGHMMHGDVAHAAGPEHPPGPAHPPDAHPPAPQPGTPEVPGRPGTGVPPSEAPHKPNVFGTVPGNGRHGFYGAKDPDEGMFRGGTGAPERPHIGGFSGRGVETQGAFGGGGQHVDSVTGGPHPDAPAGGAGAGAHPETAPAGAGGAGAAGAEHAPAGPGAAASPETAAAEASKHVNLEVDVVKGDNLWNILKHKLEQASAFKDASGNDLSIADQNRMIFALEQEAANPEKMAAMGLTNLDHIEPGDHINLGPLLQHSHVPHVAEHFSGQGGAAPAVETAVPPHAPEAAPAGAPAAEAPAGGGGAASSVPGGEEPHIGGFSGRGVGAQSGFGGAEGYTGRPHVGGFSGRGGFDERAFAGAGRGVREGFERAAEGHHSDNPLVNLWKMEHPGERMPASTLQELNDLRASGFNPEYHGAFLRELTDRIEGKLHEVYGMEGDHDQEWLAFRKYEAGEFMHAQDVGVTPYGDAEHIFKLKDYMLDLQRLSGLRPEGATAFSEAESIGHYIERANRAILMAEISE